MDLSSLFVPTAGPAISGYMITQHNVVLSRESVLKNSANLKLGKSVICHNTMLRGDLGLINSHDYVIFCEGVIIHPGFQKKKQYAFFSSEFNRQTDEKHGHQDRLLHRDWEQLDSQITAHREVRKNRQQLRAGKFTP